MLAVAIVLVHAFVQMLSWPGNFTALPAVQAPNYLRNSNSSRPFALALALNQMARTPDKKLEHI